LFARASIALGLLLAALLWPIPPSPAAAAGPELELARQLAAPWPALQRANGRFVDALQPGGRPRRHACAVLGYGLLLTGANHHDRRLITSAVRAISAATRNFDPWYATRAFKVWAVAAAYNVARERLRHRRAVRAALPRWARWLRHQQTTHLQWSDRYENKFLVDALAVLELQRTGLVSHRPGAVVGGARGRARALALRLINRRIPAKSLPVLSDAPGFALAYHALSYAMYARAVRLLGAAASRRARAQLPRLGRASWLMAAPDGDVAYWGRSLASSWTLAATAYGLDATSAERRSSVWRGRAAALGARLLARLRSYGVGPRGEWITPGVRQDAAGGSRGIDGYSNAVAANGLALVFLNWAARIGPVKARAALIAADRPMRALLGRRHGRFAVVREGNLWFAVKQFGSNNLRYDFGPVAIKRFEDGTWRDVIPLRPVGFGSAGPTLVAGGRSWIPSGTRTRLLPGGVVEIEGGFRDRRRWIRRGVRFRVAPVSCGVELSVVAEPDDKFQFSAFLRGAALRQPETGGFVSATQAFTPSLAPVTTWIDRHRYASASDSSLTRVRLGIASGFSPAVGVTLC
jgi:hypothetical protein